MAGKGNRIQYFFSIDRLSISIDRLSISIDRLSISIDQLSISIDRLSTSIDRLSISIDRLTISIDRLTISIDRLTISIDRLTISIDLTTHSILIYRYMASGIWLKTIMIVRKENRCRHFMGYSFQLTARDILYAPSHRQDSTVVGTRNSPKGPPCGIDPTPHRTMN